MKTTIKQFAKNHNLTEGQCLGSEKIEGSLDLSSLTSIPEGFNPTVGEGKKDSYTIADIAELTKGQYGNSSFVTFFKLKL